MITPDELADRVEHTWGRIEAAGGDRRRVRLVAVTKGFGAEVVEVAVATGLFDLGESYAQELVTKAGYGPDAIRWHFLGAIQRRKVRVLAPLVHLWHTVAREAEVSELAGRCPGAAVLVQVNLTGEPGRNGCRRHELDDIIGALRGAGLDVRGVMGVGPAGEPEAARPHFRWLAAQASAHGLADASMGMSHDLEVAVEEGATIVRVGSGLFGPRPLTSMPA